ncbi:MAG: peptide-methionine (R)-S-oxide reductase [Acidimicrobiales bacterium]|jgi:peptide-methionine (R)-S-oxide reductase
MTEKTFNDEDLRSRLSPEQYEVTQQAGTERPFTGEYWNIWDDGTYACIVCDTPLFESDTKFDAGCGWPSFSQALSEDAVEERRDMSLGMLRTEVLCKGCGAHLGHVFPDGPTPTGLRYCMNSASLSLDKPEPSEPSN